MENYPPGITASDPHFNPRDHGPGDPTPEEGDGA